MNSVRGVDEKNPWENGGKKPSEYTWEEFNALDGLQQEFFFLWFDSADAFEVWMTEAQKKSEQS
jgi:hypothetical protein